MNDTGSWIKALSIFVKYPPGTQQRIMFGYDECIYAGPSPTLVSEIDLHTLHCLGWHIEPQHDCFYKEF